MVIQIAVGIFVGFILITAFLFIILCIMAIIANYENGVPSFLRRRDDDYDDYDDYDSDDDYGSKVNIKKIYRNL